MAELTVVRRYARALFDSANRAGAVEQLENELQAVDQLLRQTRQLTAALRAPTIPLTRKRELLNTAFGSRVSPLTLRFLHLVVDRRREDVLPQIYGEFRHLANELRGILPVQVTAATRLTDEERDALVSALTQRTGKQIRLEMAVDPALMGGVVLRMGDTVIDGSVRTKLAQLRQRLFAGQT